MMRQRLYALLAMALSVSPAIADGIDQAVADAHRPAADRARDANRHPAALLRFAGIAPGEQVADIMPGGGYFTRMFSVAVGPAGHVYAIVPEELAKMAAKVRDAATTVTADPAYRNISLLVQPIAGLGASLGAAQKLDLAWTSDNYHDVYQFFGPGQAKAMDRAVFAALKPGGVFLVIDHVGGAGAAALHRIDPAVVKAQVLAAGFLFDGQSDVLSNASDTHALTVFDPAIRGRTDQFVYRFRKPK